MLDRSSDNVISGSLWQSVIGTLARTRMGAIQWLILCAAGLVIAIALGTAYFAGQFRARALEVAERELNNTALLLSRHFDQQLGDLQHVHDDVVSYICRPAGSIPQRNSNKKCRRSASMRCCAPSSHRFRMSGV
jgi:hypothetical protein